MKSLALGTDSVAGGKIIYIQTTWISSTEIIFSDSDCFDIVDVPN